MEEIRTYIPVKHRTCSAQQFIKIIDSRRDNIETSRFIPPKIGESGFGKFEVVFRNKELIDVES